MKIKHDERIKKTTDYILAKHGAGCEFISWSRSDFKGITVLSFTFGTNDLAEYRHYCVFVYRDGDPHYMDESNSLIILKNLEELRPTTLRVADNVVPLRPNVKAA